MIPIHRMKWDFAAHDPVIRADKNKSLTAENAEIRGRVNLDLTSQSAEKGKLVPVQVPWRVSFSTPFLTFNASEFEARHIDFVATFWSEMKENDERKVKLSFKGLSLVLIKSPVEEDRALSIENFDYDRSELKDNRPRDNEKIASWGERFNKKWQETGFCPDPRMYEVIGSQKFASLRLLEQGFKHYLIIGEMIAFEFLCKSWIWEAGDTIKWFKE